MTTEDTTIKEMTNSQTDQQPPTTSPHNLLTERRVLPWMAPRDHQVGQTASKPAQMIAGTTSGTEVALPQTPSPTGTQTLSVHVGLGAPVSVAGNDEPKCEIPKGLYFEGSATFPCSVTVRGRVKGSIKTDGDAALHVAVGGEVDGEMKAKTIAVEGGAKGTIDASGGSASFGPEARCNGTILYARVSIAEGAEIEATMKKST